MGELFTTILINPIFNVLVALYKMTGSLGFAIITLTVFIRTLLVPAMLPSIKMSKKQRDMQPELDKIRERYKDDKKKQAEAQMELLKKHGINPASGCVTTIFTIVIMIAFYQAVTLFTLGTSISAINSHLYLSSLKFLAEEVINTKFLYLDLTKPDPYFIIAFLSGFLQFVATKMIMPYAKIEEKAAKKTAGSADDMMQIMQKQNMYLMPIIIFWFSLKLPSGVALYIIASTVYQIVQTYLLSGPGGLRPWLIKLKLIKGQNGQS